MSTGGRASIGQVDDTVVDLSWMDAADVALLAVVASLILMLVVRAMLQRRRLEVVRATPPARVHSSSTRVERSVRGAPRPHATEARAPQPRMRTEAEADRSSATCDEEPNGERLRRPAIPLRW